MPKRCGGVRSGGAGAIVNNSRGIIFAHARREYAQRFCAARCSGRSKRPRDMIEQSRTATPAGKLHS